MSRWFSSKLDAASLHVMLALRAARRAVFPVARCQVDGLSIAIRVSTPNEHHRADTYATKEPETIEWLRENLRDGDVFYDVGANIGLYSLYAAKLRPACRVFAFEPESHNFGNLCRNLLLNRVANVTPCFFPLSSREAFAPFYVYDLRPGGALHSLGRPSPLRDEPPLLTTGALTATIDALVSRHGLPAPDLIKLQFVAFYPRRGDLVGRAQGCPPLGRVQASPIRLPAQGKERLEHRAPRAAISQLHLHAVVGGSGLEVYAGVPGCVSND
jgi:FkbM family methyltransferase